MHAIKTGPVGIYARFSSELQNERSIEDQVRRCRDYIAQQGGDATSAQVFPDFAVSGASLDRPGFEALMSAVDAGRIKAIITEDMSRISRDFADSAQIFKRLQFLKVPLVGVADGIDTSAKHAKLSFTVKSLVADMYLDDLRDKTLRGLEGRALAGFATGNVAYGYHTVPVEEGGRVIGNKIEIHPRESIIIRRIFEECRSGRSYAAIASGLNRERIPSPRVGSRHKCFGWGSSTIRAILYNERYAGVWRFKERQWVKVPGTNRRQPQARNAADIMTMERPDLRIIEPAVWTEVQARLAAVRRNYTKRKREGGIVRKPTVYLLSGLLHCAQCGAPMSISAGSNAAYYRCQGNRTKGTCPNRVSVREDIVRRKVIQGIQDYMLSDEGVAQFRKRIAEELRDYSRNLEARRKERVERLARTEEKIRGLIEFIATGDRSEYVVAPRPGGVRPEREGGPRRTRPGGEPAAPPAQHRGSHRARDRPRGEAFRRSGAGAGGAPPVAARGPDRRGSGTGRADGSGRAAAADGAGRRLGKSREEIRRGWRRGGRRCPKTRNPWREQLLQGYQVVKHE